MPSHRSLQNKSNLPAWTCASGPAPIAFARLFFRVKIKQFLAAWQSSRCMKLTCIKGAVLEKGCVYVVPLMEQLDLPAGTHAVTNAKSSTGRLDLLTRTISDYSTEFDRIAPGYRGPLYAEICPRSFSVLVRPGMRLNQIRFRAGQAILYRC